MAPARANLIAPLIFASFMAAPAFAADNFYSGKTINVMVGFSAGGGYDVNARTVARHLGKHIPGNPNVIVQNMPGAGSLTAVRHLDATAPTDGTVMAVFNPGLVTRSIVDPKRVKVDFRDLSWVGIVTADFRVCYGFGPKGVKSWADLMSRKEFVLGSTAKGAGNYINGATLKHVFHAPVRQILGFPGSAEQRIAIERGELDGDCGSFSSIPTAWVRDGKVHPFVRFTEKKAPEIPDSAVYIKTFAKTEEQKQLLDVLNAADEIGRPFIVSKKVPSEHLAILRNAFNATMKDPAFLSDMAKQQLPVYPLSGEEAEAVVVKMSGVSREIAAKAKALFD